MFDGSQHLGLLPEIPLIARISEGDALQGLLQSEVLGRINAEDSSESLANIVKRMNLPSHVIPDWLPGLRHRFRLMRERKIQEKGSQGSS
jgi:hypothetical protein